MPIDPLHNLMAIPPMEFTAWKLVRSYANQLSHLPPLHLVRTITMHNPALLALSPTYSSMTLGCLLSFSPVREFTLPPCTCDRHLSRDRLTFLSFPLTLRSHNVTWKCLSQRAAICLVLIVYQVRSMVDGFISTWVLQLDLPHCRGLALHSTSKGSLATVLLAGIQDPSFQSYTRHHSQVDILMPFCQVINHV
jgi:hypothetical protein